MQNENEKEKIWIGNVPYAALEEGLTFAIFLSDLLKVTLEKIESKVHEVEIMRFKSGEIKGCVKLEVTPDYAAQLIKLNDTVFKGRKIKIEYCRGVKL